jgi:hypothetical protein
MGSLALGAMIVALAAGSAHAEVLVRGGVPFTAFELEAALAVRGATVTDLLVYPVSRTVVELTTAAGNQRVDLGAARGPAAARLVALQLAPLGVELDVAPGVVRSAVVPGRGTWRLGVAAGGGRGVAAIDFALTVLRIDAVGGTGRWRWGGGVGWLHGLARTPDSTEPATADLGLLRAFAGVAIDRFEVIAGPELVPYRVTAASPGITVGAGAGVRARLGGGPRWQAIASVEADGFLHRVIVQRDGVQFAATPRVALTAALGIAWGSR